jgi:hypothetical protein
MKIPTPVSKEDADKGGGFAPWPAGKYDFEVNTAEDDVSKASGREQLKLSLWIYNAEGQRRLVFDYLGSDEKSQWKVRHFCEAVGLVAEYERGELDAYDCQSKTGKVQLGIRAPRDGYEAQNSVRDYIAMDEGAAPKVSRPAAAASRPAAKAPAASALDDDNIPF